MAHRYRLDLPLIAKDALQSLKKNIKKKEFKQGKFCYSDNFNYLIWVPRGQPGNHYHPGDHYHPGEHYHPGNHYHGR